MSRPPRFRAEISVEADTQEDMENSILEAARRVAEGDTLSEVRRLDNGSHYSFEIWDPEHQETEE